MIRQIINNGFLTNRFFAVFGALIAICAAGFIAPLLFKAAFAGLVFFAAVSIADMFFVLMTRNKLNARRTVNAMLPLGDESKVMLTIESKFPYGINAMLIDELPNQFQERDFKVDINLESNVTKNIEYSIRPVQRGDYYFGKLNLFTISIVGIFQLRHVFELEEKVSVYPSVLQMKQHELAAFSNVFQFQGVRKMRRLGHSYEFEQIKNYVIGDDYRSVNWKATGRRGELMVNQYGDERSQQVYSIIDKSRVMRLPFNDMSLMDYAVNTSLVMTNISLLKHDKAGLISFSNKIDTVIRADDRPNQLKRIMDALYMQEESNGEANYQLLYTACQRIVKHRSLIILYTNFESKQSLSRVIPLLRRINRLHLLLVVFFENTELSEYSRSDVRDIEEIYSTTMAGKFQLDKKIMLKRLNQYGIQTLLTKPEALSVNTVNKYLEFKARGLI